MDLSYKGMFDQPQGCKNGRTRPASCRLLDSGECSLCTYLLSGQGAGSGAVGVCELALRAREQGI